MEKTEICTRLEKLSKEMKECSQIIDNQAVTEDWRNTSIDVRNSARGIDLILQKWTYTPSRKSLFSQLIDALRFCLPPT